MKKLWSALFLMVLCFPLRANFYVDSLDNTIARNIKILAATSAQAENITHTICTIIKNQSCLEEMNIFLQGQDFITFSTLDNLRFDETLGDQVERLDQARKDLKFALGAKLYVHYLESCKQQILNQAVKNYETLHYWQHERFVVSKSFYRENISKWLSNDEYQEKIKNNIVQLQEITQQTNYFLGLIKHSQHLLLQAITQQDFEEKLLMAASLQNIFLNETNEDNGIYTIDIIIKNSIEQAHRFNLNQSVRYIQNQLPSYFERNWQLHALTAAGLCACAFVYANYKHQISQEIQHFWNDQIQNQLGVITKIPQLDIQEDQRKYNDLILHERNEPAPIDGNTNGLIAGVQQLDNFAGVSNWMQNWNPFNSLPNRNIGSQVDEAAFYEAASLADDSIVLANPEKNLLRLPRAYHRMILKNIIELKSQSNVFVRDLYNDVHLFLCFIALIPGTMILNKTVSFSTNKEIKNFVRELDMFLNESLYQTVTFDREGHLYFLTEQLKQNIKRLSIVEQRLIETDIQGLQSQSLDYSQKFNIVQRMYKTYPCLFPGTI
ncbi:MAG: hypothetical protein JO129_03745 [Candidatus Dependentiae bacterium]|nr:hypothetical protein [Candidatus Dependentiae bacterium]